MRPSFSQIIRLWVSKPIRWVPPLLSFIFIFWFFWPSLFHIPPPHRHHAPIGHPHRPPSRPWHGDVDLDINWPSRASEVKKAFIHAYEGYKKYAWRADELKPVRAEQVNNFNGWGVTMYDALDTMWIMGLKDDFNEAVDVIAEEDFELSPSDFAPFFETVIRYLGGLLSAYALSGNTILLQKADQLGHALLPAFETPSGLPMFAVNTLTGTTRGGWTGSTLWAEALSNQMEYKYLAHLTGKREYFEKTERAMKAMYDSNITDGIFPTQWNTNRATPSSNVQASTSIIQNLLYISPDRDLLYVTDTTFDPSNKTIPHVPSHRFEHLSCFLPGLLALGVNTLNFDDPDVSWFDKEQRELHLWAAQGLAYACWLSYADQKTGLGPDEMYMLYTPSEVLTETTNGRVSTVPQRPKGLWIDLVDEWKRLGKPHRRPPGLREVPSEPISSRRGYTHGKSSYLLRPETIESFYILWRTTGDERWRDRGWAIFEAIERHAKTEYGYASVLAVDKTPVLKDEMPSYFLAETLKYLYLLFTDEEIIPLDKWVFNTEAHPLPIFEWTDEEKEVYGIN
ncbi:hypothetical protein E1B28_007617 [Marasmius oreades]|uniref:alpha-1,2-Mannosidase n=1 Tax=Marasmius oreades TaxID=181124 RepID=A0A9P7S289_9AGAR|nr:uncharacterized protein E1B28_007617 [Marasmius oreades]KAG7093987.1 hypothetical protein E1B28_007617 [Marasmius oreades]